MRISRQSLFSFLFLEGWRAKTGAHAVSHHHRWFRLSLSLSLFSKFRVRTFLGPLGLRELFLRLPIVAVDAFAMVDVVVVGRVVSSVRVGFKWAVFLKVGLSGLMGRCGCAVGGLCYRRKGAVVSAVL